MADGTGCVASVRLAEEQDTGRKKGYAFVDFVDVPSAERAVKELQGIVLLLSPSSICTALRYSTLFCSALFHLY
jgi:RNA recognition motif. (a.k.a. RRM, RBD, or RNP domain)